MSRSHPARAFCGSKAISTASPSTPNAGGAIKSLYHKKLTREFCDPAAERAFNEYRGYFIAQGRWRSSLESPVEVETIEEGPLRAKVALKGQLGGCPVRTTMTVTAGEPRIDFHVQFHFLEDTWIGDPWDIEPERRRFERRRSHHDDRWKLLVSFPASASLARALQRSAL